MKNLITRLSNIGLTKNEAKVYYFLLKSVPICGNDLSKKLKMDRTLVYQILNQLIEKKIVTYHIDFKNTRIYSITNIKNLYIPLKEKEMELDLLIPELDKLKNKDQSIKQEIIIFQGIMGIKKYLDEIIFEKEIFMIGGLIKSNIINYNIFEKIISEHKNLLSNIRGKIILSESISEIKKCISDKKFSFDLKNFQLKKINNLNNLNTTVIFKDRIATHILTENPIIIFIKSKKLAKEYKEYFLELWDRAENVSM
ncbi:MAG: helix-turn-helix domain-containing protein [Candidatus ainarchaeum sp.]|nr:helix-turn-helix domain-containing protein [Candidatus ainarchaeum sp.]MDD3976322.1 helix-turn-helix domain-containing protein [Candidatus ainarchaeum sp.]